MMKNSILFFILSMVALGQAYAGNALWLENKTTIVVISANNDYLGMNKKNNKSLVIPSKNWSIYPVKEMEQWTNEGYKYQLTKISSTKFRLQVLDKAGKVISTKNLKVLEPE